MTSRSGPNQIQSSRNGLHAVCALILVVAAGAIAVADRAGGDQQRTAAGGLIKPAAVREDDRIAALIKDLADDKFTARELAESHLYNLGEPALNALDHAAESNDADLARRAATLAREIRERLRIPICARHAAFTREMREVVICNTPPARSTVWVRSMETARDLAYLRATRRAMSAVAFSTDDRLLACAGSRPAHHEPHLADYTITLWDWKQGKQVGRLEGHTDGVTAVCFLPDNKRLLSSGLDGSLRLWDAGAGKELRRVRAHDAFVTWVSLSPDGRRALTAGHDDRLKLWNAETLEELLSIKVAAPVLRPVFSHDGKECLGGGGGTQVNQVTKGQQFKSPTPGIRIWNLETGKEVSYLRGTKGAVYATAVSACGRYILTGDDNNGVTLWSRQNGTCLKQFETEDPSWRFVVAVGFSPGEKSILAVDAGARLYRWPIPEIPAKP